MGENSKSRVLIRKDNVAFQPVSRRDAHGNIYITQDEYIIKYALPSKLGPTKNISNKMTNEDEDDVGSSNL
jgi:hypothetical protein